MKKKILAFALSIVLIFQCIFVLPVISYASYMTDNIGNGYEIDDLFEYDFLNTNGTYLYTIKSYKQAENSNITKIEIPKRIDGVKVVEIGKDAFKNAKYLEQVYIPDSIKKIGNEAFFQARSLKTLTIPGSVQTVGEMAFYKCISLEKVDILYGVQTLGNAAFGYCIALKTISVGDTSVPEDDQTFTSNRDLTIQSNPDAPIRNYADSKVKKAELPADSPAGYEYTVNDQGEVTVTKYRSSNKDPEIPEQINGNPVAHIGDAAFKDTGINSVKLPDTLKTIGANAFIGTNLTEITIPSGITALGKDFVEDKEGFEIKGDSEVVEKYVENSQHIKFVPYGPGVSAYYKLTIKINGYGSVSGVKGDYVKAGKKVSLSATGRTVNYHDVYRFSYWSTTGDGVFEDINSSNTEFTMPNSDTTITATFEKMERPRIVIENGVLKEFNAYDDLVKADYGNNKVVSIDSNAFTPYEPHAHGNPTSIFIPATLTDIPVGVFRYCSNLSSITVESGNPKYIDKNGVLFTKDGTTLIKYPAKKTGTEYTIPSGVKTIEAGAFEDCTNLSKLIISESVNTIKSGAFENCRRLSEVVISESITSIGSSAFKNCYNLTDINIPANIKAIESSVFYGCSNLSKIVLPENLTSIGSYAFYNCNNLKDINLTDNIASINNNAFEYCSSLSTLNINRAVIGNYAFRYCRGLSDININSDTIGNSAFAGCSGLSEVTLNSKNIGSNAFESCSSLTDVYIQKNVENIGDGVFYNCKRLQQINVDSANMNYNDGNGDGVLYEVKGDIKLMIYPVAKPNSSYTILNDTKIIGSGAFYGCTNLTNIVIKNSVLETIGSSAFGNCVGLTSIEMPTTLKNINSSAFYGCTNISNIEFPESLNTIGSEAFYDCNSIDEINIPKNVTSIGSQAFYSCDNLKNINVDIENTSYSSKDGVLFNYDRSKLIVYPMCKDNISYSVLEDVYNINEYAFSGNKVLAEIKIPDSVTSIGYAAFSSCINIKDIEIPEKVSTISSHMFSRCSNLNRVTIYNRNAYIGDYNNNNNPFYGLNKSNITLRGYLESTAEEYAFMYNMKFEQLDRVSEGLLVDERGVLYGYTGKDLDVVLSSNIKQIGSDAFKNPNNTNDTTYQNIKTVRFPMSVQAFEPYAFNGCNGLTSLNVSQTVYDIQKSAFKGCSNLAEINISSNNMKYRTIGGKNGKGNGVLVNRLGTTIYEVANGYKGPDGDGKFTLPSTVTFIEDSAFAGCSLKEISLGNVVKISVGTFEGAFVDGDITINLSNVVDIDNRAFANCTGITEIKLPATLERLGDNVFDGCTNIKNIYVEDGNAQYLDDEGVLYAYVKVEDNPTDMQTPLALVMYPVGRTPKDETTYKILNNTVQIYDNAFNNCSNIEQIDIPESVYTIGERAFDGCNLKGNLILPNGLSQIKAYAFANNELLAEVSIPKTVTSLATGAFTNCSKLYSVKIYNDNLKFGTEGKIFDEEKNDFGDNQLTIYGNKDSTSEKYVVGRNINFEVLGKDKNKISITLNAVGNPNATVDLTPDQAKSVIQSVYSDKSNEIELNINVSSSVYSVSTNLPKSLISSINSIANSQGNSDNQFDLTINTPIANISLNKEAIARIDSNSSSSDIRIIVKNIDVSTLNISSDDKAKIADRPVVGVEVISGSNIYDLEKGTATISIPYNNLNSEISNMQIVAISNGLCANLSSNLDSTNKYWVFSVKDINSKFAVSKIN